MATSGTIYGTTNNSNISVEINWTLEQSISGNYTKVTATLRYFRTDTGYTTYGTGIFGVVINGVDYGVSKYASIDHSGVDVVSNTVTVSHNADGTHSPITISGYGSISGTSLSSTSISGSVSLPTIPRATTPVLSPSSADMGSSVTIDLTGAASSDFTHDLTYKLPNGTTGTIATGLGKTTKSWTVPDFANAIPNAAAGTVTITCVTKSGGTTIGTKNALLTAKVPASVVPIISNVATSEATDGIAAQFGAYIQSKSKLAVSITAAGAKGSTASGYSTTLQGKAYTGASFTSDVLTASGSVSLVTTVTDSRGRTAKLTTTVTVLAYTPPQISAFSAYRVDASGAADDSGDYAAVSYAYTIPSLNGGNTAAMTVKYKRSIDTDYSNTLLSGAVLTTDETDKPTTVISSDYRWDLKITVSDYFGTASSATVQLPSGQVILDISADGLGIGVGKTAEGPGLDINWAARLRQSTAFDAPVDVSTGFLNKYLTAQKLLYLGENPIASPTDDTLANWSAICGGLSLCYFSGAGHLTDQPNSYGLVLTLNKGVGSWEIYQLWLTKATGAVYYRGGNANGWSGTWRPILDSSNFSSYAAKCGWTLLGTASGSNTLSATFTNYHEVIFVVNFGDSWSVFGHVPLGYFSSNTKGINMGGENDTYADVQYTTSTAHIYSANEDGVSKVSSCTLYAYAR